jgi:hypothetical protein
MLTADDIKTKSSKEGVKALSPLQLQALVDTCYAVLDGMGLNTQAPNYSRIYDQAAVALFDWYVGNPSMLSSFQQGRWIEAYDTGIPPTIQLIVRPILGSPFAKMETRRRER